MAEVILVNGVPVLADEHVLLDAAVMDSPPAAEVEPPEGESPTPEGQAPSERVRSVKPPEAGWDEWQRRQDTVRTLAREFDEVDHGDIREYLQGKTTREMTDEEIGQFKHDILAQRVSDIADILDEQLRSTSERMKRARRTVRVQAPRGWLRRAFNTLDERAASQVAARLLQRGHDPETISSKVVSRIKDEEARQRIQERLDKGDLKVEFSLLEGNAPLPTMAWSEGSPYNPEDIMEFATRLAEGVAANIRVPDVRVEVPVNVGGQHRRVIRDEQGLVKEIVDE